MKEYSAWFLESKEYPGLYLAHSQILEQRVGDGRHDLVLCANISNCMSFWRKELALRWQVVNSRHESVDALEPALIKWWES